MRKASQGVTERCNLFLITSQARIEEVLETTFPGCSVTEWRGGGQLQGRLLEASKYVSSCFKDEELKSIAKKSIADHMGISAQNLSTNILRNAEFDKFIRSNGLEMTPRAIRRVVCGFEPVEGGYIFDPTA